jgi:hypothetical protein
VAGRASAKLVLATQVAGYRCVRFDFTAVAWALRGHDCIVRARGWIDADVRNLHLVALIHIWYTLLIYRIPNTKSTSSEYSG